MLTLAFDCSSKTASVAVLRDGMIVYDIVLDTGRNHSEVLLPGINQACQESGCKISEIDLFACAIGPGSFTGLRIGVSTLKGLMIAQGKPAVGVSSLAALALNAGRTEKTICSVMDAGRGQVYTARYRMNQDGALIQTGEEKALSPDRIKQGDDENVVYVGDGAVRYADEIRKKSGKNVLIDLENPHIHASSVGILALKKLSQGDVLDLNRFTPIYLRSVDVQTPKTTAS
jgi:tRNA threonylcarbamoyladenosine biosynthesis protein TsaB